MAIILIDLLLTILACSNLLAAEISDQKYNQERFNNYIAEDPVAKQDELKRYKWMAEGSSLSTHSSANDIRGDERQPATSPLSHHTEAVGNLNKQEKLLNAVALIQQVLESSFSSEHRKEANKTELSKLTREVFPAAKKETLASEFSPIEEAISGHNEETDKAERYSNEKAQNEAEFSEKQDKLKREFWERNSKRYLNKLSSGQDEPKDFASNELNNFDSAIEINNNEKVLQKMEEDPRAIIKRDHHTLKVETVTDLTEKGKQIKRRDLLLNPKAKPTLKNLRKAKLFNIRRKRIGELGYNIENTESEKNSNKRDCGDPDVVRRNVDGCSM